MFPIGLYDTFESLVTLNYRDYSALKNLIAGMYLYVLSQTIVSIVCNLNRTFVQFSEPNGEIRTERTAASVISGARKYGRNLRDARTRKVSGKTTGSREQRERERRAREKSRINTYRDGGKRKRERKRDGAGVQGNDSERNKTIDRRRRLSKE